MLVLDFVADAADYDDAAAADGEQQDAHAAVTFGLLHRQIGSLDERVAETDVDAAEEEVGTADSAAAACAAKGPPHL